MVAMIRETSGTAQVRGASPQKQALLDAFESVLKKQAEDHAAEQRQEASRRRSRHRVRPAVWTSAALALFLCTYLYVERPDWLFPASVAAESLALQDASLRIGMANTVQHLERHRQRTGKLPRTLAEAGTQPEGITYQPLDSTEWRLTGTHGGLELTLASDEPLATFLGSSFEMISRRAR